jgi:hypothetical protein
LISEPESPKDAEPRCNYRDRKKTGKVRLISVDGSDCGVLCWQHGEELVSPGDKLITLEQVSGRRKSDAR